MSEHLGKVAMAEDGGMTAWIETIPAKDGGDASRAIVVLKDLRDANGAVRTIFDGGDAAQGLAWSRDGKLAFIANTDSEKQLQLYVAERPGRGKPRKVTNVEGYLAEPHWSPDGRTTTPRSFGATSERSKTSLQDGGKPGPRRAL